MKTVEPAGRSHDSGPRQVGEGLRVLIIDDELAYAEAVAEALERVGYRCDVVGSGRAGARKIESEEFDVVLTDLRMPDMDGLAILRKAKQELPDAEVVVLTGHSDVKTAVEAMQQGAANYVSKDAQMAELRAVVEKAAERQRLTRANRQLQRQLDEKFGFEGVIGDSPRMKDVLTRMKNVAPTSASVLIQGETGTGKELVAKALHTNSPRRNKPFIEVNCSATTESLLDDLLFGHVPGSYTGADRLRKGVFEEANGGTLFLDEVGDMPIHLQAKLLRVLEDQKVYRIGSNEPVQVNVRILSATLHDLAKMVEEKRFRPDLYFRLQVVTIRLPPLRERREDIPLLVSHFMRQAATAEHKKVGHASEAVMRLLREYHWPGNVRELRNLVHGMVVLDTDGVLDVDDLRLADPENRFELARPAAAGPDNLVGRPLAEVQRYYIEQTLERTGGNREEAAKLLGIGERTLYRVIRDWKLQDQIREALDGAGGDVVAAAKSLGLTEAALQRKIKKLGLAAVDEDDDE